MLHLSRQTLKLGRKFGCGRNDFMRFTPPIFIVYSLAAHESMEKSTFSMLSLQPPYEEIFSKIKQEQRTYNISYIFNITNTECCIIVEMEYKKHEVINNIKVKGLNKSSNKLQKVDTNLPSMKAFTFMLNPLLSLPHFFLSNTHCSSSFSMDYI